MKKVLMSMRVTEATNYFEKRNSISYDYIEFFESLGYFVVLVPNNTSHLKKYFEDIDLVVLTGGNNVSPQAYNSDDKLDDVYIDRDKLEGELIKRSLGYKIPILGICRGFHFVNVYLGGKLTHYIQSHVNNDHKLDSDVDILEGQRVNSFHNNGIQKNDLSSELEILAMAGDFVEGFICRNKQILGIQWHPERQEQGFDRALIRKFIKGNL